jgi:amino acid adenylation domain-containing protein
VRLLRATDREQLQAWNRTAPDAPGAATVLDFFAAQVRRTPDRAAVMDDDRQLSYRDLELQSRRLAHALRAVDVGPGKLAGICMDRSPEMVVGLLAILRAGAAYVPLDPDYPAERIRHVVADTALTAILSQAHLAAKLPAGPAKIIPIESVNLEQADPDSAPGPSPSPDDPLYVIYTSGSTGRPKGVVLPHRALANLIQWQMTSPRLAGPARTLQFTSLNFDVSAQEIFGALSTGGTLVLVSEETRRDPDALLAHLALHRVERLYLPFVALEQLATSIDPPATLSLRDVITAGEQLKATPAIREFFRCRGDCRLHNHYGPTESHVVTSYELAADVSTWDELPPIGRPIANTEVHVLDEQRQPVPPGIPGELYIGGRGLATGYLNHAGLTGERFIEAEVFGRRQRLYRTGDRCRWRPDGQLEFLGRVDDQIKFRGIRIEPGEIEVTLTQHEAVREAAVVLDQRGDSPRLVAYLTCRRPLSSQLARELRAWLRERLPDHMIPAPLVELAALPVTANGKTDRRALASAPGGNRPAATPGDKPPRTGNERVLAALWQELLGVESVGRHDNFFDLGGHSLLATQLLSRIRRAFPVELSLREVFDHPTIAELTTVVERSLAATPPEGGPADREEIML